MNRCVWARLFDGTFGSVVDDDVNGEAGGCREGAALTGLRHNERGRWVLCIYCCRRILVVMACHLRVGLRFS